MSLSHFATVLSAFSGMFTGTVVHAQMQNLRKTYLFESWKVGICSHGPANPLTNSFLLSKIMSGMASISRIATSSLRAASKLCFLSNFLETLTKLHSFLVCPRILAPVVHAYVSTCYSHLSKTKINRRISSNITAVASQHLPLLNVQMKLLRNSLPSLVSSPRLALLSLELDSLLLLFRVNSTW